MTSQRARDRLVERLLANGIESEEVLEVMRRVPRHLFVDEALASRAYENSALPIGHGQTVSQPFIVARMTELILEGAPDRGRVLEVGGGSGYQAAVLSYFFERVHTIERIAVLAGQLRERMYQLRYDNVKVRHGDGGDGWPEAAPFAGILVAAAPTVLPEGLLTQLQVGARLVVPVGEAGAQQLQVVTRTDVGFEASVVEHVSFVPMLQGLA